MQQKLPVTAFCREGCKGPPHVGLHVAGWLVTDLDAVLQDALWHNLGLCPASTDPTQYRLPNTPTVFMTLTAQNSCQW